MNEPAIATVTQCINIVLIYLKIGFILAVVFSVLFVQRIDSSARLDLSNPFSIIDSIAFRIVIIPGVSVFWPLFLYRLLRGKKTPMERTAHRLRARATEP